MKNIERNDSSICYKLIENKLTDDVDTIIFFHGLGLDQTTWDYLLPELKDYRLLTFDFRWHGSSTGAYYASDEENWQALFQDFFAVMEKEELERYHFVTHGIGTHFCIELISRGMIAPETVTFLSTPCYYPGTVAKGALEHRESMLRGKTGRDLGEGMAPQLLVSRDSAKAELIINAYSKVRVDLYMDLLRLNARALSLEKLTKIEIPTLLLNGEYDINYPPSLTTLSSNYLPNCSVKIISQASNMVQIDQPEETARLIKEFIRQSGAGASRILPDLQLPYLKMLYKQSIDSTGLVVRIDFLTIFKMEVNGRQVLGKWNQRKAKELIAYLAYYGKTPKEKLYAALWVEANTASAQNLLRVSLNHLRSLLKDNGLQDFVLTDAQYVWLNPVYQLHCDVKELMERLIDVPSSNLLFSDLPVEWIMDLQYELEKNTYDRV